MKRATIAVLAIVLGCAALWAQKPAELNAEVDALTPEQVAALRAKASAGDAAAQLRMGRIYESGHTVSQDNAAALDWYQNSAAQGDAVAQYWLAAMYFDGRGVKRDLIVAMQWWVKSANQGYAPAQRNLARVNLHGADGILRDPASGLRWYRKAAESGDPEYEVDLAQLLVSGTVLPRDYVEAMQWMTRAAEKDGTAQLSLGLWYEHGAAGLKKDIPRAIEWMERAGANGTPFAYAQIGLIHENGEGVPQDYVKAAHYYQLAADHGDPIGKFDLGYLYQEGKGVPRDGAKAVELYEATAVDVPTARNNLADLYESGGPIAVDREKAYFWALLNLSVESERMWKGEANPMEARLGRAVLRLQRVRKGLSKQQRDAQFQSARLWLGAHRPALQKEYEHFEIAIGKEK